MRTEYLQQESKSLWLRAGGVRLVGNESEWSASDHRSLDAEPQQHTHHPDRLSQGVTNALLLMRLMKVGWRQVIWRSSVASSVHAYAAFWARVRTVCSSIQTCELTGLPCRRSTEDRTEMTIIVNWSINLVVYKSCGYCAIFQHLVDCRLYFWANSWP